MQHVPSRFFLQPAGRFNDGVLELTLPKKAAAAGKCLSIQ